MKKVDKKLLIKAAEELNKLLFGPDDKDIIDVDAEPDMLCKQIKEAAVLLKKAEDDVSKETIKVLRELFPNASELSELEQFTDGSKEDIFQEFEALGILDEKEKPTDPPKGNDDLFAEVDNAEKMKDLKDIAKSNDEFKGIRGELSKHKSTEALRTAMLDVLDELEKPEKKKTEPKATMKIVPKDKPDIKKSTAKKVEKPVPKEKESGITRQTAVFISIRKVCKNPSSVNEIAEEANSVYMKNNPESKGISKLQNMSNVVRHSVLALVEFDVLSEKDGKYSL